MIDQEHQRAQELAAEAAAELRAGNADDAARLYGRAAQHEERALANVPHDKPRTLGIIGVSLAALHFKAGRNDEAARVAASLLESSDLPPDARAQLEEIAEAAQIARAQSTMQASHH